METLQKEGGPTMLTRAREIAEEAAKLLREGQRRAFAIEQKSSTADLVTEIDCQAEAFIYERLREEFPTHSIMGEEGAVHQGSSSEGYRWFIDPLDGTNNFAHRIPHFAVSMGLFRGQEPVLGVVCDAMRQQTYWAEKGSGAYLGEQRLQVSASPTVEQSILASGFPYDRHHDPVDNIEQVGLFLKKCRGFRRFGAAALDLAMVASGSLDGFWEFKLSPWDVAAGVLLVTEAGGRVTRIQGLPLGPMTQKIHLVASNGHIHAEMLAILRPSLSKRHQQTGQDV